MKNCTIAILPIGGFPTTRRWNLCCGTQDYKVIARPHPQLLVAEPEVYFGKVTYNKLVFPQYGKRGKALHPGPQRVDPDLWAELLRKIGPENP